MMTHCKERETLAERILRKAIVAVVVLALLIPVMTPQVFAASTVTINGGDDVSGGDTFTVEVTFGGGNIGRVDGAMTYDTDMLTYISGGSSTGNSGYIQLSNGSTDGSVTFSIEFQALTDGETTLEVTTNEMYDLDEAYINETPSASKTITIAGSAASEEVIEQTESPEQPVEETELKGVDEKPEEEEEDGTTLLMVIAIAVPVILIIIIAVVLAKKKRGRNEPPAGGDGTDGYDGGYDDGGYDDGYDNSAGPDSYRDRDDVSPQPAQDEGIKADRAERMNRRKKNKAVKKRASEETENWSDWNGFDDHDLR